MGRALVIVVFSLAAGSAAFAGAGLAVAPHADPPGVPGFHHDHVLTAYRYLGLLDDLEDGLGDEPRFTLSHGVLELGAALVLAILVPLIPGLPRPPRHPLGPVRVRAPVPGRDREPPIPSPPRPWTLRGT